MTRRTRGGDQEAEKLREIPSDVNSLDFKFRCQIYVRFQIHFKLRILISFQMQISKFHSSAIKRIIADSILGLAALELLKCF